MKKPHIQILAYRIAKSNNYLDQLKKQYDLLWIKKSDKVVCSYKEINLEEVTSMDEKTIKKNVYDFYDKVANEDKKVLGAIENLNKSLGYTEEDLKNIPEEAQLGLGCGNPKEKGKPQEGEIVADLGSGKGMDVFLAAKSVGNSGRVVGIDSNYTMVEKAREIATKRKFNNVEFRLGEIEYLPLGDNTIDLLISNCVINLSTDKEQVYKEIYRVLKTNGRISISDIILINALPEEIKDDPNIYGT